MDSTSTSTVSYRPYKSKRHSRTISADISGPSRANPEPVSLNEVPRVAPRNRPASIALVNGHSTTSSLNLASPIASTSKLTTSSGPTAASSSEPPTPMPTPTSSTPTPTPTPTSTLAPTPSPPRRSMSTFRRIAPPSQPSPLRAASTLTVSPSFSRRRFDSHPQSRPTSTHSSSPVIPTNSLPTPAPSTSSTPPPQPASTPTPQSPAPISSSPAPTRPSAPYRPGFQPKGVYRPLTDDFLAARSKLRDRDKVEQRRLERRLEKLIALHFSPEPEPKPQAARRSSLLLDFSKNPAELWRDVLQRPKADIRAEEQNITPWQDDSSVSHCFLCSTSFHPLTNRKHHCRLCGRIVCARIATQTCSLLFVVDQKSGAIEEVGEGVDYGVRRKGEDDKFLRGVRVCRECRVVLLRQQYLQEAGTVPTYVRLYSTLMSLEKEIEDALPQFQELVLSLSTNTPATTHTSTAELRTRLLASFAEYDRLAKRIRQLPAVRGSSQDRVQGAILTRASLFLQKNMFPLQSLPKQPSTKKAKPEEKPSQITDKDSALAHALQPLLEQEALLEAFVEEAKAQRKFEDAKTLKTSLGEIRAEIARVSNEM